jgi:hypothetical protein
MRASPFIGGHFHCVRAPDYARETAQYVHAAEHFDSTLDGCCDAVFVAHVDCFGDDSAVWELRVQFLDGLECLVGVHVP